MSRIITVAATQMACTWDIPGNIVRAESLVRKAAADGAQIVLVQELFEAPYFCQDQIAEFFDLAKPFEGNPLIRHFSQLAAELDVVLPISFFEKAGQSYFNSVAIIDADGTVLGFYRKSHIPDGPGYTEKYYFSPGDTGFEVWQTKHATIGVGICWDQWFPEAARAMALQGAELLLYPTAIGSEPQDPTIDSAAHWQRVMQGHAAANLMPVIASNRIGLEPGRKGTELIFYGSSFITDQTGAKVAEADRISETVLTASFDLDGIARQRAAWGLFRDRRPELYHPLLSLDGQG
ncbi:MULTISPECIES: N-carbamoylputrescine amidase [Alphaproteobacteria]|uniref:N-carbamoylputrescine amidohydrolase n=2 Tax=Alphaproteobacteria TaxID=28211 RepID=A0A512HIB4_9HYPH|nr:MULTISPECIES: N-carbamoylputrescine amidase [Alphaproteobacteria]GEO85183.1 N-carbamoylputrescine amidohydrolase [Ciceribacter naphthalenivorans]